MKYKTFRNSRPEAALNGLQNSQEVTGVSFCRVADLQPTTFTSLF